MVGFMLGMCRARWCAWLQQAGKMMLVVNGNGVRGWGWWRRGLRYSRW